MQLFSGIYKYDLENETMERLKTTSEIDIDDEKWVHFDNLKC